MWGHLLDVPKFFFTLLPEYIRLTKSISRCIQNSVELLRWSFSCKISQWLLAGHYFRERTSSQKLDWVLNTPPILSSNVNWHAYKLIVETKISRLGVSLICHLYVKKEAWIETKLYCAKIKLITSNTEDFKIHLQ